MRRTQRKALKLFFLFKRWWSDCDSKQVLFLVKETNIREPKLQNLYIPVRVHITALLLYFLSLFSYHSNITFYHNLFYS